MGSVVIIAIPEEELQWIADSFLYKLSRLQKGGCATMKLELGKFEINDVQFAEKSYIENHVLYVNTAEVEALVLEDD